MADNLIKVINGDSKKKSVGVKNIEPISNIQIIRDASDSSSDSELSEISKYRGNGGNGNSTKKKKKVLIEKKKLHNHQNIHNHQNVDYSAFSNPKKISSREQFQEDSGSEYSSVDSESDSGSDSGDSRSNISDQPEDGKLKWEQKQKLKQDLLIKINSLEKKGFEFSKKFNMSSNYEEMMFDYEKVKRFIESQAAIKFSRRCLMACVTGLEFVNKKFDPFSVKLEGWSENVMENVDDYDNIFERLHEKYAGKAEIAPEIELLLTLGGSAFMFHLTNSLLKGPSMGSISTIAQNNPNFMPGGSNQVNNNQNQQNSQIPQPIDTRGVRKEMRGPSIDKNLFANTPLVNNYPKPPGPVTYSNDRYPNDRHPNDRYPNVENPIDEDDRFSVASSDSSLSSDSSNSSNSSISSVPSVKKVRIVNKKGNKKNQGGGGFELNIK